MAAAITASLGTMPVMELVFCLDPVRKFRALHDAVTVSSPPKNPLKLGEKLLPRPVMTCESKFGPPLHPVPCGAYFTCALQFMVAPGGSEEELETDKFIDGMLGVVDIL